MPLLDRHCQRAAFNARRLRDLEGFGPWASDPVFLALRNTTKGKFQSPIRLFELFAGLGTGYIAHHCLLLPVELVGHLEISETLRSFILKLHGTSASVRIGLDGDIMRLILANLPIVDVLIAGPPCPPFSGIGARQCWSDCRTHPFWRTLDIIAHLARNGLWFFIIENVEGFGYEQSDGCIPVLEVIEVLQEKLGPQASSGWSLDYQTYNASDFCLPQNRPRIYLVGRKSFGKSPKKVLRFHNTVGLSDILSFRGTVPSSGAFMPRDLNETELDNLKHFKVSLRAKMYDPKMAGKVACFPYDRTPSSRTKWTPQVHIEKAPCLTATGPVLFFLSLGQAGTSSTRGSKHPSVCRVAFPVERGAIQGLPCWYITGRSKPVDTVRAVGNSMALPVLVSVLAREYIFYAGLQFPDLPEVVRRPNGFTLMENTVRL